MKLVCKRASGLLFVLIGLLLSPSAAMAQSQAAPSAETAAQQDPRFEIKRFIVKGATLISIAETEAATAPFVGKDKDFADVQRALEAIERLYTVKGYTAVQVILPEQELDRGEVQFAVQEARIGKVVLEGNKFFDTANIRNSLPALKEGAAPNTHLVAENLRLANESSAKQTTVLLRSSQEEGQVDAAIRVADENPIKYSLTFDNSGTRQSGIFRIGAGFQHANLFNRDHVLSVQYVTAPHDDQEAQTIKPYPSKSVFVLGGAYHVPLYGLGDSIDISVGQSNVNSGVVQNLFNISGSGTIFGIRYNRSLPRWGDVDHKLVMGWDWRAYHSYVTVIGGPASLVPDVTVQPLSLTYSGVHRSSSSDTNFYVGVYQNLPAGRDAGQQAFNASRTEANAGYFLQRYGVSHNRSFSNDMQLRASFSGQFTRDRLISGEHWGLGGADSVRGFLEREITSDWGFRGSAEIYSPDIASKFTSSNARARLLAFYDWGRTQRNRPNLIIGEGRGQHVSSIGFGARISLGSSLFLRADYGVVLDPGGLQGYYDGRGHVTLSYIF